VARQRAALDREGIPHMPNDSHIVPAMIGDPVKTRMLVDYLMHGRDVSFPPINYPIAPKGTEKLRITPSPLHTNADIPHLINALSVLRKQCVLARALAQAYHANF
jgi:5-aminolevulinate synthase